MKKKIAIIGSGFFWSNNYFGIVEKHSIDLYEKKNSILNGASRANQMRFHQGYHYPRSIQTLNEVKKFNKSFLDFMGMMFWVQLIITMQYQILAQKQIFNNLLNF